MICDKYQEMSRHQKIELIGKIQHAISTDEQMLEMAQSLIEIAEDKGLLKDVEISEFSMLDLVRKENSTDYTFCV